MSLKIRDSIELRSAVKHCKCLEELGFNQDGVVLYRKLRRVEVQLARACVAYSNESSYGTEQWEKDKAWARDRVEGILGAIPDGFFINSDPRGYMLKIGRNNGDDESSQFEKLHAAGMHHDMGDDLILAPENFS